MRVVRSHRIALVPTAAQEVLLRQAVGVSRFAYNWDLAEWKRQYQAGEKPSEGALRRQLNAIKREQFPWMELVPKSVPQQAIKNCGAAFERFFKRHGRYPKFKKKGVRDSARLDNGPGTFKFEGQRVRLPVIGWVSSGKNCASPARRFPPRSGGSRTAGLSPCPSRSKCPKLSVRAKRRWALISGWQQAMFRVRSHRGRTTVVHAGVDLRVWHVPRPGY